ncbi:hypothetical protein SK128_002085 [Halocaridina rubra]|uniref:Single domain-containing protein n=1 Tax=Halocaridina rubra TaxID=373956 RepID=A0AAN9AEZ5_HALRR
MMLLLAMSMCFAVISAQNPEFVPKTNVRDLAADELRDFPGHCFASTACRVFPINQQWSLRPFCGRSTCLQGPNGLIERVEECGLRPKDSPGCVVTNKHDLDKDFPTCCPKYSCKPGAQLLYPTEAELRAVAKALKVAVTNNQSQ